MMLTFYFPVTKHTLLYENYFNVQLLKNAGVSAMKLERVDVEVHSGLDSASTIVRVTEHSSKKEKKRLFWIWLSRLIKRPGSTAQIGAVDMAP